MLAPCGCPSFVILALMHSPLACIVRAWADEWPTAGRTRASWRMCCARAATRCRPSSASSARTSRRRRASCTGHISRTWISRKRPRRRRLTRASYGRCYSISSISLDRTPAAPSPVRCPVGSLSPPAAALATGRAPPNEEEEEKNVMVGKHANNARTRCRVSVRRFQRSGRGTAQPHTPLLRASPLARDERGLAFS